MKFYKNSSVGFLYHIIYRRKNYHYEIAIPNNPDSNEDTIAEKVRVLTPTRSIDSLEHALSDEFAR